MFDWTFNWIRNIKISFAILLLLLIIIPTIFKIVDCCKYRKHKIINQIEMQEPEQTTVDQPITDQPQSSTIVRAALIAKRPSINHHHGRIHYDKARGYVWTDGCPV